MECGFSRTLTSTATGCRRGPASRSGSQSHLYYLPGPTAPEENSPAMPFYRSQNDDLVTSDGDDFRPDDVPRAVVAVGADLITKGMELGVHSHRKAQLLL